MGPNRRLDLLVPIVCFTLMIIAVGPRIFEKAGKGGLASSLTNKCFSCSYIKARCYMDMKYFTYVLWVISLELYIRVREKPGEDPSLLKNGSQILVV